MSGLRQWQREALHRWQERTGPDFLVVATPGAGKTRFALEVASRELAAGTVNQVVVITPSDRLRTQWADAAAAAGLNLDPNFSNSRPGSPPGFSGVVLTYAQVAAAAALHAGAIADTATLVICDEVHHAGDSQSWGDALRVAARDAAARLHLSGTPWRSDDNPIPFVTYAPAGPGELVCAADYTYGYAHALADDVVRPVLFAAYTGESTWVDRAGHALTATLGQPLDKVTERRAWRTALHPGGQWIRSVLGDANTHLMALRRTDPTAGGLVIASNQTHARAYARLLSDICGTKVPVAVSDDPSSAAAIDEFTANTAPWLVAVRLVSEGVDITRLRVGVYATNIASALYFTQAVGRFVRARSAGEDATVFLPSVRPLLALAAELETVRDHVIRADSGAADEDFLPEYERLEPRAEPEGQAHTPVAATGSLDRFIAGGRHHDAGMVGALPDVGLVLPGMLDAGELWGRPAPAPPRRQSPDAGAPPVPAHRAIAAARQDLAAAVSAVCRARKLGHAQVHTWLRQECGGPDVASATLEQLLAREAFAHSLV